MRFHHRSELLHPWIPGSLGGAAGDSQGHPRHPSGPSMPHTTCPHLPGTVLSSALQTSMSGYNPRETFILRVQNKVTSP